MKFLDDFFNSIDKDLFLRYTHIDKFELNSYLLKNIKTLKKSQISLLLNYRLIDETLLNKNLGSSTIFILLYDTGSITTDQTIYILENFKVNIYRMGGISIYNIGAFKSDYSLLKHYVDKGLDLVDEYDKSPLQYSKDEKIIDLLKSTGIYNLALDQVGYLTIEPIPSSLSSYFIDNDLKGLLEYLSPIKNYKRYHKYVFSDRLEYFNLSLLLLNREFKFNPDILKSYLELHMDSYLTSRELSLFIKIFKKLKNYSEKRLLNLIVDYELDDDFLILRDLNLELDVLVENKIAIPKFKTIKELHNFTSVESCKLSQTTFKLNQQLPFTKLDFDSYKIKAPTTNYDLIKAGSTLHICVGNGIYSKSIQNKEIYILLIYKNKKLIGCVELNLNFFITQARGYKNNNLDGEFIELLQSKIFEKTSI